MTSIHLNKIIDFLKQRNYNYEFRGDVKEKKYTIASIFLHIDAGFYFLTAGPVPEKVCKSIFLVKEGVVGSEEIKNGNGLIIVQKDPQTIFYEILNYFFYEKSTGVISGQSNIHPEAVIEENVQIDPFCIIGKCTIKKGAIIGSNTKVYDNTTIGENTFIEAGSNIGTQGVAWCWNFDETEKIIQPQLGGVEIGDNCFLGAGTIVVRGSLSENTIVGDNCLLAPGARLGHGTIIGKYGHFANNVVTGGNTIIGENCFVGSAAVFRPKVRIHNNTVVGAGSVVVKNTSEANKILMGVPAKEYPSKDKLSGVPKLKRMN